MSLSRCIACTRGVLAMLPEAPNAPHTLTTARPAKQPSTIVGINCREAVCADAARCVPHRRHSSRRLLLHAACAQADAAGVAHRHQALGTGIVSGHSHQPGTPARSSVAKSSMCHVTPHGRASSKPPFRPPAWATTARTAASSGSPPTNAANPPSERAIGVTVTHAWRACMQHTHRRRR